MDSPPGDKEWASKYLLDPLTAPEPSQETGPGSRLISSASGSRAVSCSKAPTSIRDSIRDSKKPIGNSYPTPPSSASPSQSSFHPSNPYSSHRQTAIGGYPSGAVSGRNSSEEKTVESSAGRRRGSSLGERFPGDMSHRPLDQLRKEAKAAHRSPHLRRKHLPGADLIDSLDRSMGTAYHHEGPYDATLISRNTNFKNSPVEAVRDSNIAALRATPRENIRDALDKHVPLQGVAIIPPGMAGHDGKPMNYEEGADLMREEDAPGGAYKQWEGMNYHPEDYKGKGEPSFTIERALKQDSLNSHRRMMSEGYEMQTPSRQLRSESPADLNSRAADSRLQQLGNEGEVRRSNTTGRQVGERIRRRLGSFRKSLRSSEA